MNRIDELAQKAVDQVITPDEVAELDAMLEADEQAALAVLASLELEAALRGLRTGFDLTDSTLERIHDAQIAHTEDAVLTQLAMLPPAPWEGRTRLRRRWRVALVGSAMAAGIFFALWFARPVAETPSDGVARIVELTGKLEVMSPDGTMRNGAVGEELKAGQTLRTPGEDSFAIVEYHDSTRLELQSDTLVRLTTDPGRRIVFSTGVLRTCVSKTKPTTPTVVVAPQAEVRAGDACFLIASASPDASRIDLEAGNAQIVRQSDGRSFPVMQGSYTVATMTPDAPVVQQLPAFRTVSEKRFGQVPARVVGFLKPEGLLSASFPQVSFWDARGIEQRFTTRTLRSGGLYTASTFGGANLSADGSRLAVCTSDGIIHIWDTAAQQEIRSVDAGGQPNDVLPLTIHREFLAAAEPLPPWSHKLRLWRLSGGPAQIIETELKSIRAVAASPDGKLIAVGGEKKSRGKGEHPIWLLDALTGMRVGMLPGMNSAAKVLAFSADSRTLAAGGTDSAVRVWDVQSQMLTRTIIGHERPIGSLAFSPDGTRLAGGTPTGQVWVWNIETGIEKLVLQAGTRMVWGLTFSPDGKQLFVAEQKSPPAIWDVATD